MYVIKFCNLPNKQDTGAGNDGLSLAWRSSGYYGLELCRDIDQLGRDGVTPSIYSRMFLPGVRTLLCEHFCGTTYRFEQQSRSTRPRSGAFLCHAVFQKFSKSKKTGGYGKIYADLMPRDELGSQQELPLIDIEFMIVCVVAEI